MEHTIKIPSPYVKAKDLVRSNALIDIADLILVNEDLLIACKGAVAALTQNKTYPADIVAAKSYLETAIAKAEGKEV